MVTEMRRHQEWDSQQDRQHKGLVTADAALFLILTIRQEAGG